MFGLHTALLLTSVMSQSFSFLTSWSACVGSIPPNGNSMLISNVSLPSRSSARLKVSFRKTRQILLELLSRKRSTLHMVLELDNHTRRIITLTLTLFLKLWWKLILWCSTLLSERVMWLFEGINPTFSFSPNVTLGFFAAYRVQASLKNPPLLLNGADSWEGLLDFYKKSLQLSLLSLLFHWISSLIFFLAGSISVACTFFLPLLYVSFSQLLI